MSSIAIQPVTPKPTWRTSMAAAVVATLSRPSSWAVCLAGFLARGGILLFLVPLVGLPTTASLANQVVPVLQAPLFGNFTLAFLVFIFAILATLIAWFAAGGLIGAWADVISVREGLADEDMRGLAGNAPTSDPGRWSIARVAAARLIAHAPVAIGIIAVIPAIVLAAYAEMTNPGEVVTHLFIRTLAHVPLQVVLLVIAWWLGEVAGGLAARRIAIDGAPILRAVVGGWMDLVRHPATSLLTMLVTTIGLAVAVIPALLAASFGWRFVRLSVRAGPSAEMVVAVTVFVLIWIGGLVIAAAAVAWRSHAWTAEWLRWRASVPSPAASPAIDQPGTIGEEQRHDRGDWSASGGSGTL